MGDAVIVAGARTAIGTARKGTLLDVSAFDLAKWSAGEALKRSGIPGGDVDDLMMGEVLQGGGDIARYAAIELGLTEVPGVAFNRHCASGMAPVQSGAASIMAGMDDGWSGKPDLNMTLEKAPSNTPIVLLLHEPDLVDETSLDPRITLQLSGHTHGGQVLVAGQPPIFTPDLGKKYSQGLFRVHDTWLYTNRGLGVISVPLRLNCPPEVTLLTLTRA
jgi:hypothetical protein